MEYIDIFDENNNPTGEIKEKVQAHEDGEFHRTAHVWVINDNNELLLQKRSASKKSHPNCWDISGAGHIREGESVIDGAIRELKEELGDPRCAYGVGACYHFGDGVEQDKEKAKSIHIDAYKPLLELIEEEKQNQRKQSFSKFCLGAYYYFGFGDIEKNEKKAFELIHDYAIQAHLPAIYDLGANFYYNGVGTEKNLRLSEYYLKMAVDAGLPRAKVKFEQYKNIYENEIEK